MPLFRNCAVSVSREIQFSLGEAGEHRCPIPSHACELLEFFFTNN